MRLVRALAAQVLWWACAAAAVVLAVGVLLVALQADTSIDLVRWSIAAADAVGLGVASPTGGLFSLDGEWGRVHSALVNGALGCAVLLGGGALLSRLVGPR
ncbi:MAG: hypothetical protein ACI379_17375 [Nocardioides sp.]|uniref:hypothetical protein n=1 Tax=Nocardioides sp. TaxID=35761 RepID=UPI003F00D462